jgi:hypothetical protein
MAHYAFLNEDNIVQEVLVGIDEDNTEELPSQFPTWELYYSYLKGMTCKRTSYNTIGNEHLLEGTPFRGNFAGIGFTWDEENQVFIPPMPEEEGKTFTLNTSTWLWEMDE